MNLNVPPVIRHEEIDDEITPEAIAEVEESLANLLFEKWLRERGGVKC